MPTTTCPAPFPPPAPADIPTRRTINAVRRYLTLLCLPPGPTRLVGGVMLTQQEQREREALAAWRVLRAGGPATVGDVGRAARPVLSGAGRAIDDLAGAGVVEAMGGGLWGLRGAGVAGGDQ